VQRLVAVLVGLHEDVAAEVVSLGGLGSVGVVGLNEAVQGVVLVLGDVAASVGICDLVAVAVVGRACGAAKGRSGLRQVSELVVGVVGGRGRAANKRGGSGLDGGDLLAEGVVDVGRSAAQGISAADHVAVGIVGELAGFGGAVAMSKPIAPAPRVWFELNWKLARVPIESVTDCGCSWRRS